MKSDEIVLISNLNMAARTI